MNPPATVPARAWLVVAAGTAVNLCLGILYAWSVWKKVLTGKPAGTPMAGPNEGWMALSDTEATTAYAVCGLTFALCMVPGGRVQDRYGPRVGAALGGLCLAAGCVLAGLMRSYLGLVLGFGLLGGIGMGFGYAASTPAAVRWFGPGRRGLVVGLVVAGYGAAAVYIAPLANALIGTWGLSGSFIGLGVLFAVVVVAAGGLLAWPPAGYIPPAVAAGPAAPVRPDWTAGEVVRTWQFYALVFVFFASAQAGLLVIANAALLLGQAAEAGSWLAGNAWVLVAGAAVINALGRVGTGQYSDRLGRRVALAVNGVAAAGCMLALPAVLADRNVTLLFVTVGVAAWQYGGCLALLPALTADFYGAKNLGLNYGLVFIGWGLAFLVPLAAGAVRDWTGSLVPALLASGGLVLAGVAVGLFLRPPAGRRL
jgi:OFA family oxalate/formate antiporter-like MFS transporter